MHDTKRVPMLFKRLLMVAVMVVIGVVGHISHAAAADGPVSLTIEPSETTVFAGDAVVFDVTLANMGDTNISNILLTLMLDGPVEAARIVPNTAESSGIRVDGVRRDGNQVQWKGGMQAGGKLVFALRVKTSSILTDDSQLTLAGTAGPTVDEPLIDATATVTVAAYDLNPNDLSLRKSVLVDRGDGFEPVEDAEVQPGQEIGIELALTNNSAVPVYTLLVDQMTQSAAGAAGVGMLESGCRLVGDSGKVVQGRGFRVPNTALGAAFNDPETFTYAFMVKTNPGETTRTRVRASVMGQVECSLEGRAQAYSAATGPGTGAEFDAAASDAADDNVSPRLAFVQSLLQQQPLLGQLIVLYILLSDFGDAPDSTNHFMPPGTMTAYPGVSGRFPTVFDPATGLPQGPKHKNGLPLHLGARVSGEWAVDMFLRRNLNPPADTANLDLHDDGVDLSGVTFSGCLTTLIPFEVTINQQAIDHFAATNSTAYLNIWLDGNRDGDWEDSMDCDGLTAVEHIVIDQPIAPAAPGTYALVAATGNLPVPLGGATDSMWLRATISDEPSVKTGSFQNPGQLPKEYGDGQGPAGAFRWGETEDYLYVPPTAVAGPGGQGPDLWLTADAVALDSQSVDGVNSVTAAAAQAMDGRKLNLKLRTGNLGDRLASTAKLVIETEPYLGIPTTVGVECCICLTCTVASNVTTQPKMADAAQASALPFEEVCEDGQCHLELALGDIAPGGSASLIMGWPWPENGTMDQVQMRVRTIWTDSAGTQSQQWQKSVFRPVRTPTFTGPTPGTWTGCLTCTVAFRGFADPGVVVGLASSSFETGNLFATADELGFWEIETKMLDGIHEVQAWTGCLTCTVQSQVTAAGLQAIPAGSIVSEPLVLEVDDSLLWNPASFGFSYTDKTVNAATALEADDSCGPWHIVDDAGRMDLNGWTIPVWPGKEIELVLQSRCDGAATATLQLGDNTPIDFVDDGNGLLTAVFTPDVDDLANAGAEGLTAQLIIGCDAQSAIYAGRMTALEPNTVVDAETGAPLGGMDVTLWSRDKSTKQFAPWEAQAFGQTNPQTTDTDGHFSYLVPDGQYGLLITGPGYQPYRVSPFRHQGGIQGFNIGMPPTLTAVAAKSVVQITEDGFLPATLAIQPGDVVEWQNLGLGAAGSVKSTPDGVNASAGEDAWDSGALQTGERFQLRFDREGTYTYVDSEDPSKSAVIRVVPPEETGRTIYLPQIRSR